MKNYFYNVFPDQLATLTFRSPNEVIRKEIAKDDALVFFGGPDWKNIANDLHRIPEQDRCHFTLCLFMAVLTDQALYTHFPASYEAWRNKTNYPKFGWAGFGPHYENPFKLLSAPEQERVIDTAEVLALIPEFCRFLVNETTNYFQQHLGAMDVPTYFSAIKNDPGYAFNEGTVVPRFKTEFEALTSS